MQHKAEIKEINDTLDQKAERVQLEKVKVELPKLLYRAELSHISDTVFKTLAECKSVLT